MTYPLCSDSVHQVGRSAGRLNFLSPCHQLLPLKSRDILACVLLDGQDILSGEKHY